MAMFKSTATLYTYTRELDKIIIAQGGLQPSLLDPIKRLFLKPSKAQSPPVQCILVLGIEGAGLTTFLNALGLGSIHKTPVHRGLDLETVRYRNLEFRSWPTDGCRNDYPLWPPLFANVCGIIQIIDVAETLRFIEATENVRLCEQLFAPLETMRDVPMLILGNKMDKLTARRKQELDYDLELAGIERPWATQMTNCLTGDGIWQGLCWLAEAIKVRAEDDAALARVDDEKDNASISSSEFSYHKSYKAK